MECIELDPAEEKVGLEKDLGEQKDENENIPIDPTKNDANANTADVRYAACDIREKKVVLENPKSALDKINLEDAKKSVISSEVLSAMAQAASQDKWIEYNSEKEDLNSWLENNKPSQILRSGGVGWISVSVSASVNDHNRIIELQKSWESLISQNGEITITDIQELASQFSMTGGKWLLHVNSDQVDMTWRIVATALDSGQLGCNVYQVKVSPVADVDGVNNDHVICVYNKDFTDEEELLEVEASLRQAGLRCVLQYKPQIYSLLGVYRNNRWSLRPTIYQSQYEMNEETPVIESILEKTWFWNNAKGFGKQEVHEGKESKIVLDDDKNGYRSQMFKKSELEENDKTISRPCNYYNDVGVCNFKSGHLSKSGFTHRVHMCRHCFAINGQKQAHAEPHCPGKSRGVNEIKHFNNKFIEKGNNEVIARPCDYFNDVGSCKYSSGHLSQSGFTRRVHICRLCFSRHGDERTHPETQCDRQRKDNTDSLLTVISSLNQLKMAESRNRSGHRGKVEGSIFGRAKGSQAYCGRSRPLVDSGRKHNGCEGDGRRNAGTKGENDGRNVGPLVNSGRRDGISEGNNGRGSGVTREISFLNKKWNESTTQSRVHQSTSSEKERESRDEGTRMSRIDQERCSSAGKYRGQRSEDKCVDTQKENIQLTGNSVIKPGESEPQGKSFRRNRKLRKNDHHESKNKRKRSQSRKEDSSNTMKKMDMDVEPNSALGLLSSKNQTVVSDKNDQLKTSKKSRRLEKTKALKKRNKSVSTSSKEKSSESVEDSKKMDDTGDQQKTEKPEYGCVKYSKESSMGNAIHSLANIFKSNSEHKDKEADTCISQETLECSRNLPKGSWETNKQESNDKANITRKSSHESQQDSREEKHDERNMFNNKTEEKSENKEKLAERGTAIEKVTSQENVMTAQDKPSKTENKPLSRGKLAHNGSSNKKSEMRQSVLGKQLISEQTFMTSGQLSTRKSIPNGQPMSSFGHPTSGIPLATGQPIMTSGQQKSQKILASGTLLINSLLPQLQENHPNPAINSLKPKMRPIPVEQNVEKKVFLSKSELRMFHNTPTPAFVHNLPVSKGKEKRRKPSHCPCPPYCPPCLDKIRNRM